MPAVLRCPKTLPGSVSSKWGGFTDATSDSRTSHKTCGVRQASLSSVLHGVRVQGLGSVLRSVGPWAEECTNTVADHHHDHSQDMP